jgi:hypothetical protein
MKIWIDPKLCHGASGPSDCQDCFDQLLRHRPCLTRYENDHNDVVTVYVKTEVYQTFTIPPGMAKAEADDTAAHGPNPT